MTFEEKLGLSNVNHKIIYKLILYLICNDWKQILRPETPPKFILKTFCYKNKGTREIKFTSSFSLVTLNTINPSNYIYKYIYIYIYTFYIYIFKL